MLTDHDFESPVRYYLTHGSCNFVTELAACPEFDKVSKEIVKKVLKIDDFRCNMYTSKFPPVWDGITTERDGLFILLDVDGFKVWGLHRHRLMDMTQGPINKIIPEFVPIETSEDLNLFLVGTETQNRVERIINSILVPPDYKNLNLFKRLLYAHTPQDVDMETWWKQDPYKNKVEELVDAMDKILSRNIK